jgi:hypothetical protein
MVKPIQLNEEENTMRLTMLGCLMVVSLSVSANQQAPTEIPKADNQPVLGHEEKAALFPGNIQIPARIDTGATTNSMYGVDAKVIEKNGKEYVRFNFIDHNDVAHEMTRPLVERTVVKQASGSQERYVVEMGLCVGDYYKKTNFTLADRSRMTFPILVGRNYLDESLLVSSADKNTVEPNCDVNLAANEY